VPATFGSEVRAAEPLTGPRHWTGLFIVASPRPSTGKTFLARLLTDFLRMDGGAVEAFQLSPGEIALADLLPAHTVVADLDSTPAQIALFDRLVEADGVAKVVDVGHASFERFFALADEIGFFDETLRRAIETIVLFAAEPNAAAVNTYAALGRHFPQMVLVPVFNDAILKGRRLREQYPFSRAAAVPLQIPLLPPALKLQVERSGLTFMDFYNQLPIGVPLDPALELRSWTKRAFLEFRELELRLLLEKLRASLRD
jgi:hypothetical protein